MNKEPKVVAIVGPTASGKTNFAIKFAKDNNAEIISADSRLVYKGFNIVCVKPKDEEMQGIKHYLIDVVEPEFDYSVANFYDDAKIAIKEILNKGKLPVIVGGTGLYFRILLENFQMPRVAPNYDLRKELELLDVKTLHKMLENLDNKTAQKIHFNNKVKIIRALEVIKTLNKPMSEVAGFKEVEYDVDWIGLNIEPRADLYEKINKRVDKMFDNGAIAEAEFLLKKHGRINNFINTIGYQEILAYLDGQFSLEDAKDLLKQNTRRYAKRQLTWFRRNELINWI